MFRSRVTGRWLFLALSTVASCAFANDGTYDAGWNGDGRTLVTVGSLDDRLQTMAFQSDGKIVLAGTCDTSGTNYTCAARLLPTGVVDLTFGPNETGAFVFDEFAGYPNYETVGRHGLLIQPDGRMVFAGHGSFYFGAALGSHEVATVARLSPTGTLELGPGGERLRSIYFSYNATAPENEIEAAALLANGKIIVVGSSNRVGSSPPNRDFAIARLNTDLTIDTTFNATGSGIKLAAFDQGGDNEDRADAVALQADGKIVVVGSTSTATGKDVAVLRLNADGTPDIGFGNNGRVWFDVGGHDDVAYAVKLDRQGRIVVVGSRQFSGADHDFFVARRLAADGSPDTSFGSPNGVATISFDKGAPYTDEAYDLAVQSDGKIVVVGVASLSASTNGAAAVRVLDNGIYDPTFGTLASRFVGTFAPATGTTDTGMAVAFAPGNRLMIAGSGASGAGTGMLDFGVMRLTLDLIFADGFQ